MTGASKKPIFCSQKFLVFAVLLSFCGMTLLAVTRPHYFSRPCLFGGTCYNDVTVTTESALVEKRPEEILRDLADLQASVGSMQETIAHLRDDVVTSRMHDKETDVEFSLRVEDLKKEVDSKFRFLDKSDAANADEIKQLAAKLGNISADLQAHNMGDNDDNVKVLLFTYMRSGSTFFGDFLNKNSHVAYWFEPLNGFYKDFYLAREGTVPLDVFYLSNNTERRIPEFEHQALADNLVALLNCDYGNVTLSTVLHRRGLGDWAGFTGDAYKTCEANALRSQSSDVSTKSFRDAMVRCNQMLSTHCFADDFQTCATLAQRNETMRMRASGSLTTPAGTMPKDVAERNRCSQQLGEGFNHCIDEARSQCQGRATAVKVIRLTMDTMWHVLKRDKSVKVIHLLRDPRGIVNSRAKIHLLSRVKRRSANQLKTEAGLLCNKMQHDIRVREALQQVYPDNFYEMTYESVAEEPLDAYRDLYNFLRLDPSTEVENWILQSTNAPDSVRQSNFGTMRHNSTATALKWTTELSADAIADIENVCSDVIRYLDRLSDKTLC